jgi:hypothetical protein
MDAGFVIILASLATFRKENRDDHEIVAFRLTHLAESVEKVSDKIDTHITDHAKGVM